jgi:hypothetical protein
VLCHLHPASSNGYRWRFPQCWGVKLNTQIKNGGAIFPLHFFMT